jgi:hypothetical protein
LHEDGLQDTIPIRDKSKAKLLRSLSVDFIRRSPPLADEDDDVVNDAVVVRVAAEEVEEHGWHLRNITPSSLSESSQSEIWALLLLIMVCSLSTTGGSSSSSSKNFAKKCLSKSSSAVDFFNLNPSAESSFTNFCSVEELDKGADTEGDIIGGGEQSFAKMSFIAEVTARLGIEDLLYSNVIVQN